MYIFKNSITVFTDGMQNNQTTRYRLVKIAVVIGVCAMMTSCRGGTDDYKSELEDPELINRSMKKITDVIVHDVFSPPVASRIYAYSAIAGYEALRPGYSEYLSMAGQLNELEELPEPDPDEEYFFPVASVHAMLTVGRAMTFSVETIDRYQEELYRRLKDGGIPRGVFNRSVEYGEAVAAHILEWSSKDRYKETRGDEKYTVTNEPGRWIPTPPAYMDAIEPTWNEIRPFAVDSADQFIPPRPKAFSTEEGSPFYEEVMDVYEAGQRIKTDSEMEAIARFWDCNPYVTNLEGHFMFATKKITPGGHWMGITAIASRVAKSGMMETAEAYAMVSVALADAFLVCWDEKFRSNLIRPETVINRHIDPDWKPLLETPPFPEYVSGHSVISRSAAEVLTDLYGSGFAFRDTSEVEYGLPARDFDSFLAAAEEAAISRLYGGIHYPMAIEKGVAQGRKVGQFVLGNVKTKKEKGLAGF